MIFKGLILHVITFNVTTNKYKFVHKKMKTVISQSKSY